MAIEDAYFLGRTIAGLDLVDTAAVTAGLLEFEAPRRQHTAQMAGMAYQQGKLFHHFPPVLRDLRDFVFDHTNVLQKNIGDKQGPAIYPLLDAIDRPIKAGGR